MYTHSSTCTHTCKQAQTYKEAYIYVYAHMKASTHMQEHTHIYTLKYIHIYMKSGTNIYKQVYIHVYAHIRAVTCTLVYTYVNTHNCMQARVLMYEHTCMYTHILAGVVCSLTVYHWLSFAHSLFSHRVKRARTRSSGPPQLHPGSFVICPGQGCSVSWLLPHVSRSLTGHLAFNTKAEVFWFSHLLPS